MLFRRSNRGQTEPLAALVAVSAFIVGIGIYGVYVTDTLPGTSDRTQEETAIDRVWADLEESATFYAHDESQNVASEIEPTSIPNGENMAVSVEVHTDGGPKRIAEAQFDADGDARSLENADEPPQDAGVAERLVPVTVDRQAAVRAGTLRVEVWS
ncbi:DUF7285 family protein [Halostagnicola bangensis]